MNTQEIDMAYQVDRMNEETVRQYRVTAKLWGHRKQIDVPAKDILETLNKTVTKKVRVARTVNLGKEVDEDSGIENEVLEVTVDFGGKLIKKVMKAESPYDILYQVSSKELTIEEIDEVDTDTASAEEAVDETTTDLA